MADPIHSAPQHRAAEFLPKIITVWREGYHFADLRADAMQIIWVKRLHGGIGTDRHEVGRFNDAVRQRERASTSV